MAPLQVSRPEGCCGCRQRVSRCCWRGRFSRLQRRRQQRHRRRCIRGPRSCSHRGLVTGGGQRAFRCSRPQRNTRPTTISEAGSGGGGRGGSTTSGKTSSGGGSSSGSRQPHGGWYGGGRLGGGGDGGGQWGRASSEEAAGGCGTQASQDPRGGECSHNPKTLNP